MKFSTKTKSILYGMEFSHGMRRALMSALGLLYFLSFGFDILWITSLFAASTIIMTLFEFPTGAIADYDSRKRSIMISFFLMFLAFFGLFLFESFWLLAFSWILGDIGWTFVSGASGAWSIDALGIAKKKSKIISLISRGYFFEKSGHILGGLVGLFVISVDFSLVWLLVALNQLFMFFIIAKYMEERNFKPEKVSHNYLTKSFIKAKESLSYILHKKNKQLRVLMIGDFFGILGESAFFIAMPLFFVQILGVAENEFSGLVAVVASLTIIGPLIAEKFAKKNGIKNSMVSTVFLVGIFMFLFGFSQFVVVAVLILTLLKIVLSILATIGDSAYQHEFDSKIRASLGSANNIMWAIGFAISVSLAGISITYLGVVETIMFCGGLLILEGFIYLFGLRRDKDDKK